MFRFGSLVLALLLTILLFHASPVIATPPLSTPEERAKVVRVTRELELDPMGDDAAQKRRWLVDWYERVPGITIRVCNLLGPLPDEEHPYFPQVFAQLMFAAGAFMIEHPDQANDQVAVQTAGILSALRVYEVFAKAHPEGRLPFLDRLLKRRDKGTLPAYMPDAVTNGCL